MVFSSLIFLFFFLPAVLFCYYIVPQRHLAVRNGVLPFLLLLRGTAADRSAFGIYFHQLYFWPAHAQPIP